MALDAKVIEASVRFSGMPDLTIGDCLEGDVRGLWLNELRYFLYVVLQHSPVEQLCGR